MGGLVLHLAIEWPAWAAADEGDTPAAVPEVRGHRSGYHFIH